MKKVLLFTTFALLGMITRPLAVTPAFATDRIFLQSGHLVTRSDFKPSDLQPRPEETVSGRFYRILQFEGPIDIAQRLAVEATGIRLLSYLPYNAWFVSIPVGVPFEAFASVPVRTLLPVSAAIKKDRRVAEGSIPSYAVLPGGKYFLRVQSYSDVLFDTFESGLKTAGFKWVRSQPASHFCTVEVEASRVEFLCSLPFVKFIEPISPVSEPEDTKGRSLHRSNVINQPLTFGRHFNGDSIAISLADDGEVGPHIDFRGRMVPLLSTGPGGNHGDMTSGIAVGAGNLDPTKTGMADGATLLVHDVDAGNNGYDHIYNCASYFNQYGAVITSTSYSQGCNDYNTITQSGDQLAVDNPQMTFVFSAGNRGTGDCGYGAGTPWGTITGGFKIGKNTIACANLDPFESLDNTSSRGPADDGRIKPDIASNGADQNSTDENNTYQVGGGTSAACPGIAGVAAQLYQAYKQINNGALPDGALIKSVLLNTAQDLGNEGPDFTYGFGRVNAYRAVRTLEDGRYRADSIAQGGTNSFTLTVPANTRIMKVMLHWCDLPGDPAASFQLVNDLDLRLIDANAAVSLPLVLDPTPNAANLSATAVPGTDRLNNVEQVVINNPSSGSYTLQVDGFLVPAGYQKFYLTWDFVPNEILLTYPFGGESFVPGETEQLRWDAVGLTGSFLLEYSANAGSTWNTIASVGSNARQYAWPVPNIQSDQVLVRVTRGAQSDVSDAFISVLPQPQNLQVDYACPDTLQLSWSAATGAAGYKVFRLGSRYMDEIATVNTGTSLQLGIPATGDEWFSVASIGQSGGVGRRVNAINKPPGLINCSLAQDLGIQQAISPVSGQVFSCQNLSAVPLTVQLRNLGLSDLNSFSVSYSVNGGNLVAETYSGLLTQGGSLNYTFSSTLDLSQPGTYVIQVQVGLPGDLNSANNTITVTVNSVASGIAPIQEPFATSIFPPAGWSVVASGTTYEWALRQSVTGSGGSSTDAAWFDNYSYNNSGAEDDLVTFAIDLSGVGYPELVFDVAYAVYASGYDDGLRVEVSGDCGATYLPTGYEKIGAVLASAPVSASDWFPTSASDWRSDTIDLSAYAGQSVIVKFVNINDFGNNLLLDNIQLINNTLLSVNGSSENASLSVVPNPSTGVFKLSGIGLKGSSGRLVVRDIRGALVVDRPVNWSQGALQETIDLSGFSPGYYCGEVWNEKGVVPFRLVRF